PSTSDVLRHDLKKLRDQNRTIIAPGDKEAKSSELSYELIRCDGSLSLLRVEPKTGRSHQIRVQLAALGTPIVGDVKYGATAGWNGRIALHARSLRFAHPVEKTMLNLIAPAPPEWVARFGSDDAFENK